MSEDEHLSESDDEVVGNYSMEWDDFDEEIPGVNLPERTDFASSAEEFASKRKEFIEERIPFWEEKIDFAVEEFKKTGVKNLNFPEENTKKNAARLLANVELGVKLVYNRYDPTCVDHHKDIKFSATDDYDADNESPFLYSRQFDSIQTQLQWLLKISNDPEKWYEDLKSSGEGFGPIDEDNVEDFMLFAGIEEASHALYLTHSKNLEQREKQPEHGEFYYADNWEFQALKVMTFFSKKYLPEYSHKLKEKFTKMKDHRKGR